MPDVVWIKREVRRPRQNLPVDFHMNVALNPIEVVLTIGFQVSSFPFPAQVEFRTIATFDQQALYSQNVSLMHKNVEIPKVTERKITVQRRSQHRTLERE